jgi:hypothetical protein
MDVCNLTKPSPKPNDFTPKMQQAIHLALGNIPYKNPY